MDCCIEVDTPKRRLDPSRNVPAVIMGGKYDGMEASIVDRRDAKRVNIEPEEQLDLDDFINKLALMPINERLDIINALREGKGTPALRNKLDACQTFKLDSGEFLMKPTVKSERVYIAGKSGCGKSCLASMYMREYKEMFPKRKIILLSTHTDEKAYKPFKVIQIPLNKEFTQAPPTLDILKNALVVFDDCDNLQDKNIQKAVNAVNNDLISNGRKYDIHVISLAHQLMDYSRTRNLLNEANRVIFFMGGGKYHIRRYLKVYAGLDADAIKKIMGLRSRWVCLGLTMPNYYLSQHEIGIL